jgi:hypothetical protein
LLIKSVLKETNLGVTQSKDQNTHKYNFTLSLTKVSPKRKQHTEGVDENKGMKRIFEPYTEEAAEGWRKLHNEKLHDF